MPAQPQSPPPVAPRAGRRRPTGPQSPPMEHDFNRRGFRFPPFAPEIPGSPTTTTTTTDTSSSSQFSNTHSLSSHWLPTVFEQSQPTTSLAIVGQSYVISIHCCTPLNIYRSVSFGSDIGVEASRKLADEYVKLLEMYVSSTTWKP